jgi:hypothetical protein
MAKYLPNESAVAKARKLVDARQYVLDSDWGAVQPGADAQNAYLKSHSWDSAGRSLSCVRPSSGCSASVSSHATSTSLDPRCQHLPHPDGPPIVLRHHTCGEFIDPDLRPLRKSSYPRASR